MWSGRGLTVLDPEGSQPLPISVRVPPSTYLVEIAAFPVPDPPWLFGFHRWLRKAFLPEAPSKFVPVGTFTADGDTLPVGLPPEVARGNHVLAVRLTPRGATPSSRPIGDGERERLKSLGYVQ